MDLIDEDQYAFKIHDALADLPEPPAPLHIHARAETGRLVWTVLGTSSGDRRVVALTLGREVTANSV